MNLDIYTTEMSKSVWDKAFFMDKIPDAKCIIDFGCADGAMVRFLAPLFPDTMFVGLDINEELIKRARSATPFYANNIFFGNYKDVIDFVENKYQPDEICVNFSSVLHEVFSSTPSGKAAIKKFITELKPKYITIRDMYFHEDKIKTKQYIQGPIIEWEDMKPYREAFEAVYGPLKGNPKNFLHFLMKYQWKDNGWEIELNEDYFSWTIEDFQKLIGWYDYGIVFENHYQLPYLTELWKNKFFRPQLQTHAQFILRRDD